MAKKSAKASARVKKLLKKLDFEIEDRGLEIVGEEPGFGKGAKRPGKKKAKRAGKKRARKRR